MQASDLSPEIWNAIADLIDRSKSAREVYFVKVVKADKERGLIWVKDFGDMAIPLVAHNYRFSYYDTQPTGANVTAGVPLPTKKVLRADDDNPVYRAQIVPPKVGQLVVILDPWGAKRFPICIGPVQSKQGYWEGE